MLLEAGSSLGPFRIVSLMGRGGMASVYKAYEPELDRHVALKVLPTAFLHDREFAKRFEREAKVIARLEHPHIVPIHRFGIDAETPWMSMRLLRIETLADLLKKERSYGSRMVTILNQVAEALDYAHRRKVVHRDVKPGNILFDGEGCAYVGDFGIAHIAEASVVLTRTGTIAGTPQYMSPEQALGKQVDYRTDLYALGVIAYEMVTGRLPFNADSVVALLMQQAREPVPVPAADEVPAAVSEPIIRCLEKDPARRWPSAKEFVGALAGGMASFAAEDTVLIAGSRRPEEPCSGAEPAPTLRAGLRVTVDPSPGLQTGDSVNEEALGIAFESVSRSTHGVGPDSFVRVGIGAVVVVAAALVLSLLLTRESALTETDPVTATADGAARPVASLVATGDSRTDDRLRALSASSTTPTTDARLPLTASTTSNTPTRRPTPAGSSTGAAVRAPERAVVTGVVRVAARARSFYEQGDSGAALEELESGLRMYGSDAGLRQLLVEVEADLRRRATGALDEAIGAGDMVGEGLFDDGYERFEDAQAFGASGRLLDAARAFLAAEGLLVAATRADPVTGGTDGDGTLPVVLGGQVAGPVAVTGGTDGDGTLPAAGNAGTRSVGLDDRQGIEEAVRRYARAYERESTAGLKAVFPSLTRSELDSIDRSFLNWESVTMDLEIERISVDGPRADVWMRQRQKIVPLEGRVSETETGLVLSLAKSGTEGTWNIAELRQTR